MFNDLEKTGCELLSADPTTDLFKGRFYYDTVLKQYKIYDPSKTGEEWSALGSQGIQGIQGIQGEVGPQGETGPAGEDGAQGIQGPTGPAGSGVVIKGSVANEASLPASSENVGDMYITADNGHGWVWNGSSFDDVGQIQGPAGETGAQGIQGIQGIQGETGADGADGAAGADGVQGVQGNTVFTADLDFGLRTGSTETFYDGGDRF